jgi:hypothetical protein
MMIECHFFLRLLAACLSLSAACAEKDWTLDSSVELNCYAYCKRESERLAYQIAQGKRCASLTHHPGTRGAKVPNWLHASFLLRLPGTDLTTALRHVAAPPPPMQQVHSRCTVMLLCANLTVHPRGQKAQHAVPHGVSCGWKPTDTCDVSFNNVTSVEMRFKEECMPAIHRKSLDLIVLTVSCACWVGPPAGGSLSPSTQASCLGLWQHPSWQRVHRYGNLSWST